MPEIETAIEPQEAPAFYSIAEAAKILKVSRNTLTAAINEGKIPVVKIRKRMPIPQSALCPEHQVHRFDPLAVEEQHYYALIRQRKALNAEINTAENYMNLYSRDDQWKRNAARLG